MNKFLKVRTWAGRILTAQTALILTASAFAKITRFPRMVDGLTRAGIPESALVPLAILELTCLALYLAPRTTALGATLLTGYFGGAEVVHLIGGESLLPPLLIGLVIWGGAWARIAEVREVLPLRRVAVSRREYRQFAASQAAEVRE